jgi:hypothetical protein
MLPIKIQFIWPRGFRGEDFFLIGQSETRIACTVVAMFAITCMLTFHILIFSSETPQPNELKFDRKYL